MGSFGSPGRYEVIYTVTDTAIANNTDYQVPDGVDKDDVTFVLEVSADAKPTLASTDLIEPTGLLEWHTLSTISLPVAGGGNGTVAADGTGVLKDSLSGMHTPAGGSATALTVPEMGGTISLSGGADTGLIFTKRTGPGANAVATITGAPRMDGVFDLVYKVADSDINIEDCGSEGAQQANCDTAMVSVKLTVTLPVLKLGGGNVMPDDEILLKKGVAISDIVLPYASEGNQLSIRFNPGNPDGDTPPPGLSFGLVARPQSAQSAPSSRSPAAGASGIRGVGDDVVEALIGGPLAVDPQRVWGLNNSTGALTGTPTAVGTWTVLYSMSDTTDPSSADGGAVGVANFTIEVVEDSDPVLDSDRKEALEEWDVDYVTGNTLGADADTPFALPSFTGGYGTKTESLTTECKLLDNSADCNTCATGPSLATATSTPDGLIFTAGQSGATPAGLTGTFASPGIYTVTYGVTETKIEGISSLQAADVAVTASVTFTLKVAENKAPTLAASDTTMYPGVHTRAVAIDLPEASDGNFGLTDSLSGTYTSDDGTTASNGNIKVPEMGGLITLSNDDSSGLMFTRRTADGGGNVATITGAPTVTGTFSPEIQGGGRRHHNGGLPRCERPAGLRHGDGDHHSDGDGSVADADRWQCGGWRHSHAEEGRGAVRHHATACDGWQIS